MSEALFTPALKRERPILAATAGVIAAIVALLLSGSLWYHAAGAVMDRIITGRISPGFVNGFVKRPLETLRYATHLESVITDPDPLGSEQDLSSGADAPNKYTDVAPIFASVDIAVTIIQVAGAYYLAAWVARLITPTPKSDYTAKALIALYLLLIAVSALASVARGVTEDRALGITEWAMSVGITAIVHKRWWDSFPTSALNSGSGVGL
jgi:hypothetical protein